MFSFFETEYEVLEANMVFDVMQEKYPDKYMVVMNGHVENKRLCSDIVAILSQEKYNALEKQSSIAPKFGIVEGISVLYGKVDNSLGIYL